MTRTQEKSRQKLAAERMTDAQKLCQRLGSGALKSEFRTVSEAIHMARALAAQMADAGREDGLAKEYGKDHHIAIAYMTPDFSQLHTWPYAPGKEAEIHSQLTGPGRCCIPVGLIFEVLEGKEGRRMGARPFLITPLVMMALKQRITESKIGIN